MKCPKCGYEALPGDVTCRSCGEPLTVFTEPAADAPQVNSLKDFILHVAPEKTRKEIKSSWIILYVCAGLSAVYAIVNGVLPIDGIILAAVALWLQLTYSKAAAIVAAVVGVAEVVLALATTGMPAGWIIAVVGIVACVYVFKADKAYKQYKETGRIS